MALQSVWPLPEGIKSVEVNGYPWLTGRAEPEHRSFWYMA